MNGLKTEYWEIYLNLIDFRVQTRWKKLSPSTNNFDSSKKCMKGLYFIKNTLWLMTHLCGGLDEFAVFRVKLAVEILFTRILYDLAFNSIVAHFHIYEYIHICIFRKSSFIRNKLLTEESLREDSMEEENYIPEVRSQYLYHFHCSLIIIINL